MIFSEREMTILRLLCWCKYIHHDDLCSVSPDIELLELSKVGLIKLHEESGAYSLTKSGGAFLSTYTRDPITTPGHSFHGAYIKKRIHYSKFVLTAFRSGVNVFTLTTDDLSNSPSLFLTSLNRTRGMNPWGGTRVAAISHLGDTFYAMHAIYDEVGMIVPTLEWSAFNNQTSQYRDARRGTILAGESYQSVLSELNAHSEKSDYRQVYYGQDYQRNPNPIHILSCDDTGAMQLKVMSVPGYRKVFTHAVLGASYTPPPKDVSAWDAIYMGTPFVIAIDMDLRRVDAALELANARGIAKVNIVSLDAQADEVLVPRYQDTGKAEVFALTDETLFSVLGDQVKLYEPPATQYLTKKGEIVDAPSVKAVRKAGGFYHK